VVSKIVQILGSAPAAEVIRAGAEDPAGRSQSAGDKRGVPQLSGAERQVDALLDQVDVAVAQHQFDLGLVVAPQERLDPVAETAAAEGGRRGNPQGARGDRPGLVDQSVGRVELDQALAALRVIGPADLGQGQLAGGPVEQTHAQSRLQTADLAADAALGQPQGLGAAGETAGLHHPGEDRKRVEIDHDESLDWRKYETVKCYLHG
jgi:hypothetical protein